MDATPISSANPDAHKDIRVPPAHNDSGVDSQRASADTMPLDEVPKPPSSALHSHATDTTPTHHASSEVDRVSSTSTVAVTHDANHENTERDSPMIGTAGNKIEDITQTPVFAELKAQAGPDTIDTASQLHFGRRRGTAKSFDCTAGRGLLMDLQAAELCHSAIFVHVEEMEDLASTGLLAFLGGKPIEYSLRWSPDSGFYATELTQPGHWASSTALLNKPVDLGIIIKNGTLPRTTLPYELTGRVLERIAQEYTEAIECPEACKPNLLLRLEPLMLTSRAMYKACRAIQTRALVGVLDTLLELREEITDTCRRNGGVDLSVADWRRMRQLSAWEQANGVYNLIKGTGMLNMWG